MERKGKELKQTNDNNVHHYITNSKLNIFKRIVNSDSRNFAVLTLPVGF